jgi:hypothetical protein
MHHDLVHGWRRVTCCPAALNAPACTRRLARAGLHAPACTRRLARAGLHAPACTRRTGTRSVQVDRRTFQNRAKPGNRLVMSARCAVGCIHCPDCNIGTSTNHCRCISSAIFFCAARSGASIQAYRMASIFCDVGHPNQAFSPLVRNACPAGLIKLISPVFAGAMFQPPLSIGPLFSRRCTIVPQSRAWKSALKPASLRIPSVTSAIALRNGTSVAPINTTVSPP